MRIVVDALTIDTPDPDRLASFYEGLLGWIRTFEDDGEVMVAAADGSGFPLLFLEVDDPKGGKNRLHFDLRPDDHAAAVDRALSLGASHVDIGQGADPDVTWTVLADPDGNEFCILQPSSDAEPAVAVADAGAVAIDARGDLPPDLEDLEADGADPDDDGPDDWSDEEE